jgi:hypothetical protein
MTPAPRTTIFIFEPACSWDVPDFPQNAAGSAGGVCEDGAGSGVVWEKSALNRINSEEYCQYGENSRRILRHIRNID